MPSNSFGIGTKLLQDNDTSSPLSSKKEDFPLPIVANFANSSLGPVTTNLFSHQFGMLITSFFF